MEQITSTISSRQFWSKFANAPWIIHTHAHGIKSTVLEHSCNAEIPDNIKILLLSTYVKFLIAIQPVATELRHARLWRRDNYAWVRENQFNCELSYMYLWQIRDRSRGGGGWEGGVGRAAGKLLSVALDTKKNRLRAERRYITRTW